MESDSPSASTGNQNLAAFLKGVGDSLFAANHYKQASAAYRHALEAKDNVIGVHEKLGRIALQEKRYDMAEQRFSLALQEAPDSYPILNNLAIVSLKISRFEDALQLAERAIDLGTAKACLSPLPYYLISQIYRASEEYDRELAAIENGLRIFPWADELYDARATWRLRHGDWSKGWPDYERRLSKAQAFSHLDELEEWDGSTPDSLKNGESKSLLIVGERGAGNHIMFSRYIDEVIKRWPKGQVTFYTLPELAKFFEGSGVALLSSHFELRGFLSSTGDCCWVSLASLPFVLEMAAPPPPFRRESKPSETEYFAQLLAPSNALRVGICFHDRDASNQEGSQSPNHTDLKPLLDIPDCIYYNLASDAKFKDDRVFDLSAYCHDVSDLAAAIENLDLIITADCLTSHVAGAAKKETWLLCSRSADWQWGVSGEESEWYPSARVFRQNGSDRWDDLIEKVTKKLYARAARHRRCAPARNYTVAGSSADAESLAVKPCRYGTMTFYRTDHWIGRSLDLYGEWSEGEVELFRQILKPGDTVIEAGSNIGALTIPLAQIVGETGTVHAFEPQKEIFDQLESNTNQYRNISLRNSALTAEYCRLDCARMDAERVCNLGGCEVSLHQRGELTVPVPGEPVDGLFQDSSISLIKADVEGMELDVLKGAEQLIMRCRPLLYVEDDRHENRSALYSWLHAHGYRIYRHTPPLYSPDNWRNYRVNVFGRTVSINLLCVPKERYDLKRITAQLQRIRISA